MLKLYYTDHSLLISRTIEIQGFCGKFPHTSTARAEVTAQSSRIPTSQQASQHARKAYQLTSERLSELQGLPIEALASIQTLAEARQAEIDAILDDNIAQHRLFAAINPLSPPSAPVQGRLQGPPAKSKFLAVRVSEVDGQAFYFVIIRV